LRRSLLVLVIYLLSRGNAVHIGAELVNRLHPFIVLVRIEDNAAA
jgi:hypothetical protein